MEANTLPEQLQSFKEKAEELLRELEERRGTTVLPLFYSWRRLIAKPDVDEVYECLLEIGPQPKLDVVVFSRGGDPDQAYVIGNVLQHFAKEKLTVIIPRFAKSAATLIACAADEVAMGPASELGPIDLIIERVINGKRYAISVVSVMELVKMIKDGKFGHMALKVVELIDRHLPLIEFGDYGRLTEHSIDLAKRLLSRRMFKEKLEQAERVARELCEGYMSHEAPITSLDLQGKLKMAKIEEDAWRLIWQIHRLWIEMVIEYENSFPEEHVFEPINFRLGRGIVFCTKLV